MGKKWVKGVAHLTWITALTGAVILWFCVISAIHSFTGNQK